MEATILDDLLTGLGIDADTRNRLTLSFFEDEKLPSCFNTTGLASSSFTAAAVALAEYCQCKNNSNNLADVPIEHIRINNRYASLWFDKSLWPLDWTVRNLWDSIAGDYQCADGWIRLHTNAPHHRQCALNILACDSTREAVASALASLNADDVELAIVNENGCAATMRSIDAWQQHPQGLSVASEPLIHWHEHGIVNTKTKSIGQVDSPPYQPLLGLRILDLTRVLAGPVSTRFLAGFGADVLRIDPQHWNEPGVVPEVTLGKRCAQLDLKTKTGHAQFLELVKTADVLVHGYRPGAMSGLGLHVNELLAVNPALIDVSLCAYGWTGPWSRRRGFDSLVQMSSGIAHQGMLAYDSDKPHPLPVQALDHATGYLMAAAVLRALTEKLETGRVLSAKLSLARTAHVLHQHRQDNLHTNFAPLDKSDLHPAIENTTWGRAQRVKFPVDMGHIKAHWSRPATDLRLHSPQWVS